MKHDPEKVRKAVLRRIHRADKPGASRYARANLHGKMRPRSR